MSTSGSNFPARATHASNYIGNGQIIVIGGSNNGGDFGSASFSDVLKLTITNSSHGKKKKKYFRLYIYI